MKTYTGSLYGMVIREETDGVNTTITLSFTDLPPHPVQLKLKYSPKNEFSYITINGTLTTPQSFVIPFGTYDYEVELSSIPVFRVVTETVTFQAPITYYLEVSHLNPINLVDKNRELPLNYNFKHFDAWKSNEQIITPYEVSKCYRQKWQTNDILKLQFKADFSPIVLKVRDSKGLVVLSHQMSILRTIGSDIYFEDQIAFDFFNLGVYTLEVVAGDPALITLVSEPFQIAENWPYSILLNYSNSFNNDILWETGITMNFRVDGVIPFDSPNSQRTVYIDQPGSGVTVKGVPYRLFKLYIGCDGGVPPWVIDKLEGIIDQTNVTYDGKGFAPTDGAKFETNKIDRYPWAQWNIEMRETNNTRSKRFEVDGLQEKKVVIDYIIDTKLFGPTYGSANDNSITINEIN